MQKSLKLCWRLDCFDKNFDKKDLFAREIANQILRAKKIRWFKQFEIEQQENQLILDEMSRLMEEDSSPTQRHHVNLVCESLRNRLAG